MKIATVSFNGMLFVGPVRQVTYVDGSPCLMIGDEVVSINLSQYGLRPEPGRVFIKNWSEHDGLADALVTAGVVEKEVPVWVGPFRSQAFSCRVIGGE